MSVLNSFVKISLLSILVIPCKAEDFCRRNRVVSKNFVVRDKVIQINSAYVDAYGIPVTNLGLDYYYKVISDAEREKLAELVAIKVVEKLGEVVVDTQPEPENPVNPTKPDQTGVLALLTNKCANCHTGTEKSGFSIFKEDKTFNDLTKEDWWNIFDRIDGNGLDRDKVMPKGGEPLKDEEVNLIRNYIRDLK